MEPQKTQNCQANPDGKEQSRRYNTSRLQTVVRVLQDTVIKTIWDFHGGTVDDSLPANEA